MMTFGGIGLSTILNHFLPNILLPKQLYIKMNVKNVSQGGPLGTCYYHY